MQQAQERMEKIKQKLIRATVSMPIAPVMGIQSVVNVEVLIYSVGGGLQTGMYSAQGLVCHASKMDGKSGKEWFVCKCAHIVGVTTMFGSVYNFFCVAILEHGREYTYDENTKMEIFARVLTAVSATRTENRNLALLWYMLQAGDLMNLFGNERAVIWLALLPTGKKTNMRLHLKAPDDAIAMNAKGTIDDTDVVCYVGVILAASVGDNTENRLCLITLTERSCGMWTDHLRVFTYQTAYLVYRPYDAPLWLAYIEPGTLHAIPTELRSYGAVLHHQELELAAKSMPGMEVLPEWTMAGFYGSVGTGDSNFAGQTLQQGALPKHGRRRMEQACVTFTAYRAFHPATDAAGQHVTFWAGNNSAVESKRRAAFSAQCPGPTISDGTDCCAGTWRVTASTKAVRRFAHDASLALLTSDINLMWTNAEPAPTSDNAPGTLDGQPLTAVRRVLSAGPRAIGVCHISPLRGFQKVDYRGVAPLLTMFGAARRAKCVLRIAGRGLAAKVKEPMLLHDKSAPQAPATTRELSPGSGMRADRHSPNKLTRHFPGRVSTALASASLTGPVNRAVSSVGRVGATVRSRTLQNRAGPPTVSLSHCEDSSATLRVVQAGTAAECLPSDLWSCCDTRRRRASDPGVGNVGPVGATMGYVASATPAKTAKPRALHTGCPTRASDNAAEAVPTIIDATGFTSTHSSTLTVLHALAASFLVMCVVVAALSLCPNLAHLAVLCSLLVLTSLMVLLGLYEWWCGVCGLADHSGRLRVPTPVSGDRSMWASPERAKNIRPLRVRQQATAVVLNVGRSTGWRREREMSGSPALYSFAVRRLTVLFVLSAIPHTCARADVNLATWTKPGQGLEVWGGTAGDFLGCSVAGVGDVNHDGYGDFVVGASSANPGGRTDAGAAFLVFGSASRSTATIDTLNVILPTGIQISGITGSDKWGYAVSGAGDFNKDGVDDIMIGGYGFDPTSRTDAGAVVVIFGKTSGWADVDLASFTSGSAGFWIYGAAAGDQCGTGVSAAGDVNGDGTDDIVVGANSADPQSKSNSGTSYVIFGHSTTTAFDAIDLSTFSSGSLGFKILGSTAGDFSGDRVSAAGDINGDGYKDISISALWFDGPGGVDCGAVYVIFGHSTATAFTDINLALLTSSQGFRITGAVASDRLGWSVSSAGDFNRDGYSDIVIGTQANKAYVLFGHSTATAFPNVDLSAFTAGTAGFMVSGSGDLGWSVSGGTDVNMDGIDDVIIAAPTYATTGATYVLYGRSLQAFGNLNVQTGLTTVSGFSILGQAATMESSWSVGLVKDFDGDGVGDLVIGAPRGDPSSRTDAGTAYLVYGDLSTPTSQPSRQPTGQPSRPPTSQPSGQPTSRPSEQPYRQPTSQPSVQPVAMPTTQPSRQPTSQPSLQPSRQPTTQPSRQPSARPTSSPVSERRGDVNLATWSKPRRGLEVWGAGVGGLLGTSTVSAGDVNKDGYQDILIGAYRMGPPGKSDGGTVYLVFGSPGRSIGTIDTASGTLSNAIKVLGATAGDQWGVSVSGVGDFNLDGIDDFIIGGWRFSAPSRSDTGGAVVIFGKTSSWTDVDLASFTSGSAGFWIYGATNVDRCGFSVGTAGDVNGDGASDVIVGAYGADPYNRLSAGTSYVIFGHSAASFPTIDLYSFSAGSAGFRIFGAIGGDTSGSLVGTTGDMNGDGYADLIILARYASGPGTYVVIFGRSAATAFTDIDLAASISGQGFRIANALSITDFNRPVSSAGDFNNDGYDDIVIGSPTDSAYVLFGHPAGTTFPDIDLSTFTASSAGFVVSGSGGLGFSVGGGADINGDGVDDVIIAAPTASSTGIVYVLYGRSQPQYGNINLLTGLPSVFGFSIVGPASSSSGGWSVGLVRDFDGDGVGDIYVGMRNGDSSGRTDAGTAYLIYGELSAPTSQPSSQPTGQPSRAPTSQPSRQPTSRPSEQPSRQPTSQPSVQPVAMPTTQPSRLPTSQPSLQPSRQPTTQPSRQPTSQPSRQPTGRPSHRPLSERAGDVNLATWSKPGRGLEVWGASANDQQLGYSVASAGDINMDGYDDVVIGSTECDPGGTIDAGAVFVVFGSGSRSTSVLDTASAISPKGIRISGIGTSDYWGYSVSGAGDFNNDGIADFIIGGRLSDASSRGDAGAAVVIFGKTSGWADISLASFTSGSAGFWIFGAASGDQCGSSVSSAGDVNGDGAGDVIVGSRYADPFSKANAGAAVVLFGHSPATTFGLIDLSSFASGSAGFRIFGDTAGDESSVSVGKAGDLNRDGYGDILVGAHLFDGAGGRTDSGAVYVIFGHSAATAFTDIDLATLPNSQGFRITGAAANDHLGWSVSTAGDFNHDGYTDMLIGSYSNQVYVLFGQSAAVSFSDIDLAFFTAGTAGFRISGAGVGYSVAGGADINGDGVGDIALGVPISPSPSGVVNVGNTYVLYGRSSAAFVNIDLSQGLPSVSGYRVLGVEGNQYQHSGWSVSLVRDFDGDGVGDLVVGAPYASPGGRYDTGTAYLLYGELSAPTSQPSRQPTGLPSRQPTTQPTGQPASLPSVQPSRQPTVQPSLQPSRQPTSQPSQTPTGQPTCQPSRQPTSQPSVQPVAYPTSQPSRQPTSQPSVQPSRQPTGVPSRQPTSQPSVRPTNQPTSQPSRRPTSQPSGQPTGRPSHRPLSEKAGDVNLATWSKPGKGLEVWGAVTQDNAGYSVADAGDVNKDGYHDILVGAYGVENSAIQDAGAVYLVFGSGSRATSTLDTGSTTPQKSIKISGIAAADDWGWSVSGAGDFNMDGIDDFMFSSHLFDPSPRVDAGAVVVIFGKASGWADIDLVSFTSGSAGFWIYGAGDLDHCGTSVAAAGDVNGDGASDVIVGINYADPGPSVNSGMAVVIFGHSTATAFNTISIGTFNSGSAGFRINGATAGDEAGNSVSGAGDVNHDGFSDVIVGAYKYDGPAGDRSDCGAAYVIFGHSTATAFTDINLATLSSSQGFRITGATAGHQVGYSVSSAGDFNHDGYDDIVIGSLADRAYVIFGHASSTAFSTIDLVTFLDGTTRFAIIGTSIGFSVSGGADVNGDGVSDLIIGAPYTDIPGIGGQAGIAYLLYGRSSAVFTNIDLSQGLPSVSGYRILGGAVSGQVGWSVRLVRDFDGDGVGDLVIGAPQADPSGRTNAGAAYVIYGELSAPTSQPSRQPSSQPSRTPTSQPSLQPSRQPTGQPTRLPTSQPSRQPTGRPSHRPLSQRAGDVDLATWTKPGQGLEVLGTTSYDRAGWSVADAGDINKDGYRDILIGAPIVDISGNNQIGQVSVVFGSASRSLATMVAASAAPPQGFKITGVATGDWWATALSRAGDVNKDGIDDFIIGAYGADPITRAEAGSAVVIFGKTSGWVDISLASFSSGGDGFWIYGATPGDALGRSVSAAGDVNGDGVDDIILGASQADPQSGSNAGISYVIFGHSDPPAFASIDLNTFSSGSAGFMVQGATANDASGNQVRGAGDVNADGYDEVIIGAWTFDGPMGTDCGAVYIIFGHSTATAFTDIDLAALSSSQGFRINGAVASGNLGYSLSGAGDFNHDGYKDIVIGSAADAAYVIFGHSGNTFPNLEMATFVTGTGGFFVTGGSVGNSVAGGADVNGDGVDDIILAVANLPPNGAMYVLYGRAQLQFANINVQSLSKVSGYRILGATSAMQGDWSIGLVRDFDGDGVGDILLGARNAAPSGRTNAGAVYLVYGALSAPTSQPSRQPTGQPSRQPTSQPSRQPTGRPSHRPLSERSGDVNLATWSKPGKGLEVWGALAGDNVGWSVADAGDVNKDGHRDILVGAHAADLAGKPDVGVVYLVFGIGSRTTSTVDPLNTMLPKGIAIFGAATSDDWGYSVSGAGDFNKDGIDDFVIGAPQYDPPSRLGAGAVVVIFGKTSGWADIDLASFTSGTAGFWIWGSSQYDNCGRSVSAAGDVNGDGAGDIIVGAHMAEQQSWTDANNGASYVIFGHSTATAFSTVDLATPMTSTVGFTIWGAVYDDRAGIAVSGAGDVNRDGYADLIVGAYQYDGATGQRSNAGAVYVIFGHSAATAFTDIDLAALSNSKGFRITGAVANDQLGWSVSRAGDFNHDGYDDIVFGSRGDKAYVLFGHSNVTTFPNSDLSASTPGAVGFMVTGTGDFGYCVSGGADVNGDEIDDIIIAASTYSATGAAFVLYGRASSTFTNINVQTALPSVSGFRILGDSTSMTVAWSATLVKDFDGDGVGDILVGLPNADPSARANAGTAYLIYGELSAPTSQPSRQPTGQPSGRPTSQPSTQPTSLPSCQPSRQPTSQPSKQPIARPSAQPSRQPTSQPSTRPVAAPTAQPSRQPTVQPSSQPAALPTAQPSRQPLGVPSSQPSSRPTSQPSEWPSARPSAQPSRQPAAAPSAQPSSQPSAQPSSQPASRPSGQPSRQPTGHPSSQPSQQPTAQPSRTPTAQPSSQPTAAPSRLPTQQPTSAPTAQPSLQPSTQPSRQPTSQPSCAPSGQPSRQPTQQPSTRPSGGPSTQPTRQPSCVPSRQPSLQPSSHPTRQPTSNPSSLPSARPSARPSAQPTHVPTAQPTQQPSAVPSAQPSHHPSRQPTSDPTRQPTSCPSAQPSRQPTQQPVAVPSTQPSMQPSGQPSLSPSVQPTSQPSAQPSGPPTVQPSRQPTARPSMQPCSRPSNRPSAQPTSQPSAQPSRRPSAQPSSAPSRQPTRQPTAQPSSAPSRQPTAQPSTQPSGQPTTQPSGGPSRQPTAQPSCVPTRQPTSIPSTQPTRQPSAQPCRQPTCRPSTQPTSVPTDIVVTPATLGCSVLVEYVGRTLASVEVALHGARDGTVRLYAVMKAGGSSQSADATAAALLQGSDYAVQIAGQKPVLANISALRPSTDYDMYCAATSLQGVTMPLSGVLATKQPLRTSCCKSITVTVLHPATVNPGQELPRAVTVALEAAPSASVVVTVQYGARDQTSAGVQLLPSVLRYDNRSATGTSRDIRLTALGAGNYSLLVSVAGSSAAEYSVVYVGARRLAVLSADATPAVPKLLQAAFSNDGSYVTLSFDSATDKGNQYGTFPCRTLLRFVGGSSAKCQWFSDSQLRVYPTAIGTGAVLGVGGNVTLVVNTVRASCTGAQRSVGVCAFYVPVASTTVYTAAPSAPTVPSVVISAPSAIGGCNSLTLDLAGSVGAAGRPWDAVSFAVTTLPGSTSAADQVLRFLSSNYTLSPPLPIPSEVLLKGYTYSIKTTLCNFLKACGSAIKVVSVADSVASVPVVTIVGQPVRTLYRTEPLSVVADACTQSCSGTKSSVGLQYSWAVTQLLPGATSNVNATLRSASQNPTVFKLPTYSLTVGVTYTLVVTALSTSSGQRSSAAVQLKVLQSDLAAVLKGGSTRYAMVGDILTLDASSSYDKDYPQQALPSATVSYAWHCLTVAPVLSADCAVTLLETIPGHSSVINVTSTFTALNTTTVVSVTVSDASRSSTAHVRIIILQAPSPRLSISAAGSTDNVNTGKPFTLLGSLFLLAPCTAAWSVDDPTIALTSAARTPVQQFTLPASGAAAVPFNLVIKSDALPQRATLQFTLSCGSTAVSTTVATNGAPLPGSFYVTPEVGIELLTTFTFTAVQWSDPDLPLTYQFGFQSAVSLSNLVIVSRSELSYATASLPAGDVSRANAVDCSLRIFDSLGAFTDRATTALVDTPGNADQATQLVLELLKNNADSVQGVKTALAVGSSVLNAVNCSAAPSCASLNRNPCRKTSGQCGACFDGFLGDGGDRNTPCVAFTAPPEQLVTAKSCAFNCTGHGQCTFVSKVTGATVSKCTLADTDCDATCDCVDNYSGEFCEVDPSTLRRRREVRSNLIQSLSNLTVQEDINAESVAAWSANLYALSIRPHEVSQLDAAVLADIANTTLQHAIALGVDSYADMLGVLQATDAVASLQRYNYNPNDYRDADFNTSRSYVNNTAARFIPVVSAFGDMVRNVMVLGENETTLVYDNFRMTVALAVGTRIQEPHTVPSGEQQDTASYVALQTVTDAAVPAVVIKVLSTNPRSYALDTSAYVSSPVRLQVQALEPQQNNVAEYLSSIEFTFQHNALQTEYMHYEERNFTSTCRARNASQTFTYRCPDSGHVIRHNCSEGAGVHVSYCPKPTAACAMLTLETAEITTPSTCTVLNSTASHTTCRCTVSTGGAARKRRSLSTTEQQILDDTGATDMLATTVYIASDFADTFNSAGALNNATLSSVLVVVLLLGSVWVAGLCVLAVEWGVHWWNPAKEKNTKESDGVRSILAYVDSVIPKVFERGTSSVRRLVTEVAQHHVLFEIVTADTPAERWFLMMQALTELTLLFFLTAAFFDISQPGDDGTCPHYTAKVSCLERVCPFDYSQTYCTWTESSVEGTEGACMYNSQDMSTKALFYMTVLTTVISSIVSVPIDYQFATLKAPTALSLEGSKVSAVVDTVVSGARRVSNAGLAFFEPARVAPTPSPSQSPKSDTSRGRSFLFMQAGDGVVANREIPASIAEVSAAARGSMEIVGRNATTLALGAEGASRALRSRSTRVARRSTTAASSPSNVLNKRGGAELRLTEPTVLTTAGRNDDDDGAVLLMQDIVHQRLLMNSSARETKIYDEQWGVLADGADTFTIHPEAADCIEAAVRESSKEASRMDRALGNYSLQHAGLEMLHLFMLDLLGRNTIAAKIFREKFGEEFGHSRVVVDKQKYFAAAALLALNAFFIYFVMIKGVQKGRDWQVQYVACCMVQMGVDLLLFETIECAWLNFLVPQYVHKEVASAAEKLRSLTQRVAGLRTDIEEAKPDQEVTKFFLNAPAHLFVSTKLARKKPQLLESMIVGSYRHHLPGEICKTWSHCNEREETQRSTQARTWLSLLRRFLRGLTLSLQLFIGVPFVYQKVALRFAQPVVFSGLALIIYAIFTSVAGLVVIGVCVLAVVAYAVRRWLNSDETTSTVHPDADDAEEPTFIKDDAASSDSSVGMSSEDPESAEESSEFWNTDNEDECDSGGAKSSDGEGPLVLSAESGDDAELSDEGEGDEYRANAESDDFTPSGSDAAEELSVALSADSVAEETHSELHEPDSGSGPEGALSSEPGSWVEENGSEEVYRESENLSDGSVVEQHSELQEPGSEGSDGGPGSWMHGDGSGPEEQYSDNGNDSNNERLQSELLQSGEEQFYSEDGSEGSFEDHYW
jgi:hypothetical protein